MDVKYIIVQAGGQGTRMKHYTQNKPKALVPVDNLPMIFHLFKKYNKAKFIIIGDYKFDVLDRYLATFATVDYELVCSKSNTGTCAGISAALNLIPANSPFMLIWSDLIINDQLNLQSLDTRKNYIGISLGFTCRWKYENNQFLEQQSDCCGVAGLFIFNNKSEIESIPKNGEFVRWLSNNSIKFTTIQLRKTKEYGMINEYEKLYIPKCRSFNRLVDEGNTILKEGINLQGINLAKRECTWYKKALTFKFKNIPKIYSFSPLRLEKIKGKNIYEYTDLSFDDKLSILKKIITCLKDIHKCSSAPYNEESFMEAYIFKTFERLEKVRNLIPFAKDKFVTINGKKYKNIFFYRDEIENEIKKYRPSKFVFIHGDCTFSNILLKDDIEPILIDPRGYFGKTELYGDPAYDWAKLYYSIVGNYDMFNLKKYNLVINENDVNMSIVSNGWEDMEKSFFDLLDGDISRKQIDIIHAIIWFSLTTYAWEDYDSICGAFYNGLILMEKVL